MCAPIDINIEEGWRYRACEVDDGEPIETENENAAFREVARRARRPGTSSTGRR